MSDTLWESYVSTYWTRSRFLKVSTLLSKAEESVPLDDAYSRDLLSRASGLISWIEDAEGSDSGSVVFKSKAKEVKPERALKAPSVLLNLLSHGIIHVPGCFDSGEGGYFVSQGV